MKWLALGGAVLLAWLVFRSLPKPVAPLPNFDWEGW